MRDGDGDEFREDVAFSSFHWKKNQGHYYKTWGEGWGGEVIENILFSPFLPVIVIPDYFLNECGKGKMEETTQKNMRDEISNTIIETCTYPS